MRSLSSAQDCSFVFIYSNTAITERSIFVLVCILRLCEPYVHLESASSRVFFLFHLPHVVVTTTTMDGIAE